MHPTVLRAAVCALTLGIAAPAAAQSIADRVARAPDGTVRMTFAAREGVCGSGDRNISVRNSSDSEWEGDCEEGPVRVSLAKSGGRITRVKTYVAGRWRQQSGSVPITDLGTVSAPAAAEYLLDLAERGGSGAKEAVFPATIADSVVVWPRLARVARSSTASRETRKSAIFWLGQAAGDQVTRSLDSLVSEDTQDREVREAAVFAISQRPKDEGVPVLLRIAQNDRDPKIRRNAMFWLGQSDDPRALDFFESVLAKP